MTPRPIQGHLSKTSHPDSSPPFQASVIELGKAILSSFKAVEDLVIGVYSHASLRRKSLRAERDAVTAAAINLNIAWYAVQSELRDAIRPASKDPGSPSSSAVPSHLHHQCLFATSLLQASDPICGLL